MNEQWKQIEGTHYEVSNTGKVRHATYKNELRGNIVQVGNNPRRRDTVSRLMWRAFVGEIPAGKRVIRKDLNKPATLENLYIAKRKRRKKRKKSRLSAILKLKGKGILNYEIAKKLEITPSAVTKALKRHKEKSPG